MHECKSLKVRRHPHSLNRNSENFKCIGDHEIRLERVKMPFSNTGIGCHKLETIELGVATKNTDRNEKPN